MKRPSNPGPQLMRLVSYLSGMFLVFMLGMVTSRRHWMPDRLVSFAMAGLHEVEKEPWYYVPLPSPSSELTSGELRGADGLNLITRVAAEGALAAEIRAMDGSLRHSWNVDWFELWPEPRHLPQRVVPTGPMNTHIHGAAALPDGSLVFNFEYLGMMRLSRDSKVMWRLPYRTHHSVHIAEDGVIWASGQREKAEFDPHRPDKKLPSDEYSVVQISPDGKILKEWLVADILYKNGYDGLLFMGTPGSNQQTRDDRLHLNDVEPFPAHLEAGAFGPGDVMLSLRNINTVLVFNSNNLEIKAIWVGKFIAQHDADFMDGNRISVFDNNRRTGSRTKTSRTDYDEESRIVILEAGKDHVQVYYSGSAKAPFYSGIMGKHQWLPNDHLLVTESLQGRAFELDEKKRIVWEYRNLVSDQVAGLVETVQRLPSDYRSVFPAH